MVALQSLDFVVFLGSHILVEGNFVAQGAAAVLVRVTKGTGFVQALALGGDASETAPPDNPPPRFAPQ